MSEHSMEKMFNTGLSQHFSKEEIDLLKAYYYIAGPDKFKTNIF
jgi:hypothetical protein